MLPSSTFGAAPTLVNIVAKVVYLMYEMSRRQEVLTKVYLRILRTLRSGLGGTPATTTVAERPDSM